MKDLIAKLQLDATCAMGAIWMHMDAQAKRIAELEKQLAATWPADTDKLREFVEAVATNYSGLDSQERSYCYGCDADLDDGESHEPDCIVLRAQAMLSSTAGQAPVREVPGWISVDDHLPEFRHECTTSECEVSDSIMIYGETEFGTKGCGFGHARDNGTWQCYEAEYDQLTVSKVTHWMPLPAAPVVKGE